MDGELVQWDGRTEVRGFPPIPHETVEWMGHPAELSFRADCLSHKNRAETATPQRGGSEKAHHSALNCTTIAADSGIKRGL